MGKSKIFNLMKQGNTKEVEVMGETFILRSPSLKTEYDAIKSVEHINNGDIEGLRFMAKRVMECVIDEDGEPFFMKGDLDLLINDRSGIVEGLYSAIDDKIMEERNIEDKKKK